MITFVTDIQSERELDILTAVACEDLQIRSPQGELLRAIPAPEDGWTHEKLMAVSHLQETQELTVDGADCYLGGSWVGSTEV